MTPDRTPRPLRKDDWAGMVMQDIANFFLTYAADPQPGAVDVVMGRITALGLMQMPEHRSGIAGAIHAMAAMSPHLGLVLDTGWPQAMAIMTGCRPSDDDDEIKRPGEVDYLWMYAVTCGDDFSADRVVRAAARKDAIGEAALQLVHASAAHPLMIHALARALKAKDVPAHLSSASSIPHASITSLSRYAAMIPSSNGAVLYVAWLPPSVDQAAGALVIRTPNGKAPLGFPDDWDGHPVVPQQATPDEMLTWNKLRAQQGNP